jgi:hypothetical protein
LSIWLGYRAVDHHLWTRLCICMWRFMKIGYYSICFHASIIRTTHHAALHHSSTNIAPIPLHAVLSDANACVYAMESIHVVLRRFPCTNQYGASHKKAQTRIQKQRKRQRQRELIICAIDNPPSGASKVLCDTLPLHANPVMRPKLIRSSKSFGEHSGASG